MGSQPESTLVYGKKIVASNLGEGPRAKNGTGYLSLVTLGGEIEIKKWLPQGDDKLNSPLGMATIGNKLYVADYDQIAVFDLKTNRKIQSIDLVALGQHF